MPKKDTTEHSLRLIAKSSFIVFIGIAFSKIFSYIYRILIARNFGPEVYGLYSLAFMISAWAIAIAALGFNDGLHRFLPLYRGKKEYKTLNSLFRKSLIVMIFSSIIAGVFLYLLSPYLAEQIFHNNALLPFLKFFSITIPLIVISYPFLAALRAFEEIFWYSLIFNVVQNLAKVIFILFFIVVGLGVNSVIFSHILGVFCMLVLSYTVCKYKLPQLFVNKNEAKLSGEFISYSIPLLFFSIMSSIFYWMDSMFLGYFKNAEIVGYYNAAVPIAVLLVLVPEIFMQLFFPIVNKEYARKKIESVKEISKQVGKWIFMINILFLMLVFVFPEAFLSLFFGSEYTVASSTLRILAVSNFIISLGMISTQLISMIGKSKTILSNIIVALLINLFLNLWFIPLPTVIGLENSNGMVGAALATLISTLILQVLFIFQVKNYLNIIAFKRKMLPLGIIALIIGLVLGFIRQYFGSSIIVLVVSTLLSGVTYLGVLFLTKCLDSTDNDILERIKIKLRGSFK